MSENKDDGVDIGPCPVCDQKVFVAIGDPDNGSVQKPEPGTPTWKFVWDIGHYHLRMRMYRWASTLCLWDRMQLIKEVTSDNACAEYSANSEESLADTLMIVVHQARARAEDKRAREMLTREELEHAQEQDDAE